MIPYDLVLAFLLALVAWGLVLVARAIRAHAACMADHTAVLARLLERFEATIAVDEEG